MAEKEIINRMADSAIKTFDLEDLYVSGERIVFDLKDVLFQGLILREKDLKEFLQQLDVNFYKDKLVCILCSADAIVPNWAYLQVMAVLNPVAKKVFVGSVENMEISLFEEAFLQVNWAHYEGQKVVIKGCSKVTVPLYTYGRAFEHLQKVAKLVVYGEACSNVPIWKKPAAKTINN